MRTRTRSGYDAAVHSGGMGASHGARSIAVGITLSAVLAGCTAALAYPSGTPETEWMACHDHHDQDFDHLVDCDDPDCGDACNEALHCDNGEDDDGARGSDCLDPACDGAPSCVEDRAELCNDGRDNDGDGRIDARDAGCWPFARFEVTRRCATVLGETQSFAASELVGGTPETDPMSVPGTWVRVPPSTRTMGDRLTLTTLVPTPASGMLAGTHVTARVITDSASPQLAFGLTVPTADRGQAALVELMLAPLPPRADLGVILVGDVVASPQQLLPTITPGAVLELDLEIVGHAFHGRITVEGMTTELQAELASSWDDAVRAPAIAAGVGAPSGTAVWVDGIHVERSPLVRCGVMLPPVGITDAPVPRMRTVLGDVQRGDGAMLCALVTSTIGNLVTTRSARSDDDGIHWTLGAPIVEPLFAGPNPDLAEQAALARDPITGAWHLGMQHNRRLVVAESDDCRTWSALATAIEDPSDGGRVRLLDITRPLYVRATVEGHAIGLLASLDGRSTVLDYRSPWGDPGTWEASGVHDANVERELGPLDAPTNAVIATFPTWLQLGADLVAATGGSTIAVLTREGSAALPFALGASGEAGSFDAHGVVIAPAFVEDAPVDPAAREWVGRVFYSGASDLVPDVGWGWSEIRVRTAP